MARRRPRDPLTPSHLRRAEEAQERIRRRLAEAGTQTAPAPAAGGGGPAPTDVPAALPLEHDPDLDTLHRTHCPMCAAQAGIQPRPAADFVEELYRRHAPWLAAPPSLPRLVRGDYRRDRAEHREDGHQ